jgi:hypothetical protein
MSRLNPAIKHLPCQCKAPSSNPRNAKKKGSNGTNGQDKWTAQAVPSLPQQPLPSGHTTPSEPRGCPHWITPQILAASIAPGHSQPPARPLKGTRISPYSLAPLKQPGSCGDGGVRWCLVHWFIPNSWKLHGIDENWCFDDFKIGDEFYLVLTVFKNHFCIEVIFFLCEMKV